MKKNRLAISCSALSFLLVSLPGFAKEYGGNISITTQHSDNGLRTPTDEISEWQDKYSLGLYGAHENSYLSASADYTASAHRYEKDSQPERSLIEGNSFLHLGKEHQIADLLLVHSRRGVLNQPDAVDLLSNIEERQIVSAIPTLRAFISSVDILMLRGNYSEADYRYNELRNSKAEAGSLIWQHKFSQVDVLELSAQHARVEFESSPSSDYDYQSFVAGYSAMLRQIEYRVSAGYNRIERKDGDGYSGPTFEIHAAYDSGAHRLNLYAGQKITDTSMGNGNRLNIGGSFEVDDIGRDVTTSAIDQIERSVLELHWSTPMLCDRCELFAGASARQDDYLNLAEDNTELGASIGASYRLSTASTINVRYQRREQRFDSDVPREEYQDDRVRVEYRRSFFRDVSARIFAEQRKRASDGELTDYKELIGGLSLTYNF